MGVEELERIALEIKECRKCPLWQTRTKTVPGEGNPKADIMFIGEAPGYHEDKQGRPFVGQAGKYLDELLKSIGLTRKDVYIGNILKCRPPNNRDPKDEEIESCTPYLDRQLKVIKPKIIVALGRFSARYLLQKIGIRFISISRDRGKVFEGKLNGRNVYVIPTYHPAAGLYKPDLRKYIEQDFRTIKKMLDEVLKKPSKKPKNLLDFFSGTG